MVLVAVIATALVLVGLEVLNIFIPRVGATAVALTFSSSNKESIKTVIAQIKEECIELLSYELKDRHTSHGIIFEAKIEMKVRRDVSTSKLIDYMNEFEDVTFSFIE